MKELSERDSAIIRLWNELMPTPDIARQLRVNRNVIMGAIYRARGYGHSVIHRANAMIPRQTAVVDDGKPTELPVTLPAEAKLKPVRIRKKKQKPPPPQVIVKLDVPIHEATGCRYSTHRDGQGVLLFCNQPVRQHTYWCEVHYHRVYERRIR